MFGRRPGTGRGMRLPSLPGPRDLTALLEQAWTVLPRVTGLLGEAERLMSNVTALLDRIEDTRRDADDLVARAEITRAKADEAVCDIDAPFRRLVHLLDLLEPPLLKLQPTLDRLAETTDPREVDAMVGLVDHLPELVKRVEEDVLPIMSTLKTVAPDIHDLLDVSRELNDLLVKLPGMGRVKRKVEEQQEADRAAS